MYYFEYIKRIAKGKYTIYRSDNYNNLEECIGAGQNLSKEDKTVKDIDFLETKSKKSAKIILSIASLRKIRKPFISVVQLSDIL